MAGGQERVHRLTLLLTSPRVAPGQLTWSAWRALTEADLVVAADEPHDQTAPLAEVGVTVRTLAEVSPAQRAAALVGAADRAPGGVVWLGSADGDPGLTDALAGELSRRAMTAEPPEVEVLVGSTDVPGARLLDLVAVMDTLRSPGGCPWDAEQTHETLVPYLLEEAFETAEAVEEGDRAALREELGDVLLQVAFHSRVAQEHQTDPFDVDDVAAGIVAKLVRRHPHVFGGPDGALSDADEVQARWDELKQEEKQRDSVLDGVPVALPALSRADKVLGRVQRAGLAVGSPAATPAPAGDELDEAALGAALLDLVRRARAAGLDAERALRHAVRRLETDAREAEAARQPR